MEGVVRAKLQELPLRPARGSWHGETRAQVHAETHEEKRPQHDRVRDRLPHVPLHPPGEVDHTEERRDVGEAVEPLPARVAEPLERAAGRGRGERHEQDEGGEAHEDELPLRDVLPDRVPVEDLIEHRVRAHVQEPVEEAEEAEHAA